MKLATLPDPEGHNRAGRLAVVSRDGRWAVWPEGTLSLLEALENWAERSPSLRDLSAQLERQGDRCPGVFALELDRCLAPLPHAPGFYDGSAFLSHVVRARRARGDEMPASARVTPLMYQGVSDNLLAWNAPIDLMREEFGGDFEGEFAVVTTDVPKATPASGLEPYCALVLLFNDITYREIVKTEIETKFGFLQSKPNSSFAPFAVTPDELGNAWRGGRLHADLEVKLNGERFGTPNGAEMHFSFFELVAHACRTRPLAAGSIVGTGTISNEDKGRGFACITEKRFQEVLDTGKAVSPWLKPGDRVEMDVVLGNSSVFGRIDEVAVL